MIEFQKVHKASQMFLWRSLRGHNYSSMDASGGHPLISNPEIVNEVVREQNTRL